ncbi:ATP-binding protein [Corynebacterium sp. sy039]|uniref:ATP-binding protein n=1 Tax=Corynebacterium sp. sy039 TaxID=2599641 RepID=UPI0011B726B9|nr:DUF4143 domain-containing protein [Corynebacterium sp. sy039]QDZ41815.1 ATP-binding protein [Corynebacterium sp. sy039]
MMSHYVPRIADEWLDSALNRSGGVLIEGPKGCGKSETARQKAHSFVQVDIDPQVPQQLELLPHALLQGATPRVFDEWQTYPDIWNVVRHEIDRRQQKGQFILTGSTAPSEQESRHSGAGRFARVRMSTFSFYESGHSTGEISMRALVDDADYDPVVTQHLAFPELIERLCRGGFPGNLGLALVDAMANNRDYLETVAHVDVLNLDAVRRDPMRVMATLRSLARGVGTEMTTSAMGSDVGVTRETVGNYLSALGRIFIATEQPAWSTHLRSRARLRQTPKRHLADPALAVAALDASPDALMKDLEFAGQLFESQVVHDLQVLTGEYISHGRDKDGLEVDAIFTSQGRACFVEVKLGSSGRVVDTAAENLRKFASRFEHEKPPLLLVITGTGMSYRRSDGVNVVCLSHLGV